MTPEIIGFERSNDAEFVGTIDFVRFMTDRYRSNDEDSMPVWVGFISLFTQLENVNEHFNYNDWHSTNVLPVVLPVNSSVGCGTSIEAPSMEVFEKRRRKKVKDS